MGEGGFFLLHFFGAKTMSKVAMMAAQRKYEALKRMKEYTVIGSLNLKK
ncbi:hypothetical protein GCM10010916_39020 [Paenibacillus abyssi]|uniref:Uncharacterized protein n=2 Tax=Paenibacillus abyssi TaxID=1340531 RepID=A0A917G1N8_9BACL|nr:hypothetical protein GCM10010916_39020 [Paenibacillus abyssi]